MACWCAVSHAAVHPRGCGEYCRAMASARASAGSSPRMRGIRRHQLIQHGAHRFIPADAGNTPSWLLAPAPKAVHPRGCGEYDVVALRLMLLSGSSPRMRGIRGLRQSGECVCRFIPADAGNTATSRASLRGASVHPRGCGEYARLRAAFLPHIGSSPRMRGIHVIGTSKHHGFRFIPADAGNTWPAARCQTCQAVHPRGCGEY